MPERKVKRRYQSAVRTTGAQETRRKIRAVRYDYDPDHGSLLLRPSLG